MKGTTPTAGDEPRSSPRQAQEGYVSAIKKRHPRPPLQCWQGRAVTLTQKNEHILTLSGLRKSLFWCILVYFVYLVCLVCFELF